MQISNDFGRRGTRCRRRSVRFKGEQVLTTDIVAKFLTKLAESRTADARVQELSTQLAEKDKLLSERTAELSAAQAFLTKVDAVSEAEVVRLIENLNTLISSASGSISDALDQQTPVPGALTEEPDLGRIRDYFGNLMFEQVAMRNSVAVTLAVEMYLVKFVEVVTSGWGDGGATGTLGEIYERIFTEGKLDAYVHHKTNQLCR